MAAPSAPVTVDELDGVVATLTRRIARAEHAAALVMGGFVAIGVALLGFAYMTHSALRGPP